MNNNFKKSFGARIKYLRKLQGLSQEELAELVGLSAKTISYIENGKNTISFNRIPIIAKGLGVPEYKLFVFADEQIDKCELEKLLNSATQKEINVVTKIVTSLLALK